MIEFLLGCDVNQDLAQELDTFACLWLGFVHVLI